MTTNDCYVTGNKNLRKLQNRPDYCKAQFKWQNMQGFGGRVYIRIYRGQKHNSDYNMQENVNY